MRRYETIVILDPDLGEEGIAQAFDRAKELIEQFEGRLVKLDEWGNRKLAYKIRKKPRGHYLRLDYCGTSNLVNEMERRFKINDSYLKFMTVLLEEEVDLEAIESEIAEEEERAAQAREKARIAAEEAEQRKADQEGDSGLKTEAKPDSGPTDDTDSDPASDSEEADVVETDAPVASPESAPPENKE